MERQFLRFNDYLGLSNILRGDDLDADEMEPITSSQKNSEIPSPTPYKDTSWLDSRLNEIIKQHTDAMKSQPASFTTPPRSGSGLLNSVPQIRHTRTSGLLRHSDDYQRLGLNNRVMQQSPNSNPASPAVSPYTTNIQLGQMQAPKRSQHPSLPDYPLPRVSNIRRGSGCSFCRNNKEVDEWVTSHQLKDALNRVTCPVLRKYVCPLCYASGDNAHTLGHCPLNPDRRSSLPLAVRLKTNATGKIKL